MGEGAGHGVSHRSITHAGANFTGLNGYRDAAPQPGERSQPGENGPVPVYRDEAVVLRTQKLGEADRIVTLLTRRHGRVRAVAKGVRRTGSRSGPASSRSCTSTCSSTRAARSTPSRRPRRSSRTASGSPRDYGRYTAGTAVLETAERLTAEEREPSLRLYLLVVGALRALADGEHAADAGARRVHPPGDGDRRLRAGPRRLRALRRARARTATSRSRWAAWSAASTGRPAPPRSSPAALELMAALLCGDWTVADARRRPDAARDQRAGGGVPAVAPRARPAVAAAGRARVRRRAAAVRPPTPHPSGARPPDIPADLVPRHVAMVMDGNGRWAKQRGLPRTAGHEQGESSLFDVVEGAIEIGVGGCRRTPSRPRTGSARPTRCGSSWASTAT